MVLVRGFRRLNRNVQLTILYQFSYGFSCGIWNFSVLSLYLYQLSGNNTFVGISEGIQGACRTFLAIPTGVVADRGRRDRVLRCSSVLGWISLLVFGMGLVALHPTASDHFDKQSKVQYIVLTVGLGLFGAYNGIQNPTMEALFADSIHTGQRSKLHTWKYVAMLVGTSCGPLLCMILFWQLGDTWTEAEMRIVMLVGLGLSVVYLFLVLQFDDDDSLGLQSEGVSKISRTILEAEKGGSEMQSEIEDNGEGAEPADAEVVRIAEESQRREDQGCVKRRWVSTILTVSNVILSLASGMTIKFFPLFFANEVHLSPIAVNAIMPAGTLSISLCTLLVQRVSQRLGRVQAMTLVTTLGAVLLAFMATFTSWWQRPCLISAVYVVRTALMNSVSPLVDRKWSSITTITRFGWSGSAVLGGILTDRFGFRVTFYATALMQFLAVMLRATLMGVVISETKSSKSKPEGTKRQESSGERKAQHADKGASASVGDGSSATQPLLEK